MIQQIVSSANKNFGKMGLIWWIAASHWYVEHATLGILSLKFVQSARHIVISLTI